jgi:hypothetical protein
MVQLVAKYGIDELRWCGIDTTRRTPIALRFVPSEEMVKDGTRIAQ